MPGYRLREGARGAAKAATALLRTRAVGLYKTAAAAAAAMMDCWLTAVVSSSSSSSSVFGALCLSVYLSLSLPRRAPASQEDVRG